MVYYWLKLHAKPAYYQAFENNYITDNPKNEILFFSLGFVALTGLNITIDKIAKCPILRII